MKTKVTVKIKGGDKILKGLKNALNIPSSVKPKVDDNA